MKVSACLGLVAGALLASSTMAQQATINGVVVDGIKLRGGTGIMGQMAVGDFQIGHRDEFKGAQRVAISVFNVAFPDENRFSANLHKKAGNVTYGAKASMHTTMIGLDNPARQRIADAAYVEFVADLKGAGYDVVGPDELAKLTPEYASWTALPNYSQGRFGTYVAPTGRRLFFLPGDTAKRDSSGVFSQAGVGFRAFDRPQGWLRSAYISRDGNIGIIAVTMVVDYGVYSTSGESRKVKEGSSVGFAPGVAVQSGSLYDTGTLIEYWGAKSGGFPAVAALAVPVYSADTVGDVVDGAGDINYTMHADPAKFEQTALRMVKDADTKLVAAMASSR